MERQHPVFIKYRRQWLHEVTGYSKGLLSRVATGNTPLSRSFIERVSHRLKQPEQELFLLGSLADIEENRLGQWLTQRCREEGLSLRQAAAKTGLSHATIVDIERGGHPSPETIRKLVLAFGGDTNERLVVEDTLLEAAGYRTPRPEEKLSPVLAQLVDKLSQFNEGQIKMVAHFADFLIEKEPQMI